MLSLKKDTVLVFRGANGGGRRDFFEDNNRLGPTLALSNRKSSQQQDAAGRLSLETDEDGEESIKRCWTFNHPLLHNRNTSISLPLLLSVQSDSLIHQSSNQRFLSIALSSVFPAAIVRSSPSASCCCCGRSVTSAPAREIEDVPFTRLYSFYTSSLVFQDATVYQGPRPPTKGRSSSPNNNPRRTKEKQQKKMK